MKKPAKRRTRIAPGDMLPEYDFSHGRRNPYAARMAGGHIVVVEPDVAEVFPPAAAVKEALRAIAGIIRDQQRAPRRPSKPRSSSRRGSA